MTAIVPVLLAGGGGARLWPLSTPARPKQLQALTSDRTLLQQTCLRLAGDGIQTAAPYVVTGARLATVVRIQLSQLNVVPDLVIIEPDGRNTAPAIAAAACCIPDADDLMLVLPADHHIIDETAFGQSISQGVEAATRGALVTFGVAPTFAATGYGYIERGDGDGPANPVKRFVEKPPLDQARSMIAAGGFLWNAGIFLFSVRAILKAFETHAPQVLAAARDAVASGIRSGGNLHLDAAAFGRSPAISIDHSVMENAANVNVVPLEAGWSDVGSFSALHKIGPRDAAGNVNLGRVVTEDCDGCYIRAESGTVAAIGLTGLVVVRAGEAVLVAPLDRSEDIRQLTTRIELPPQRPAGLVPPVRFSKAAGKLQNWLIEKAFPAWGHKGWDGENGGFVETMTLAGAPNPDDSQKRLRVQARQIFTCCMAHEQGLGTGHLETARRGFEYLQRKGWQEAGGWPHLFTPEGTVLDPMRDAYDHAFVLFAMAALYRSTGDPSALAWANRTQHYLDAVMADEAHGGYLESAPPVLPRRANPHMHLLEAYLALYDATGDFAWTTRAAKMVQLFNEVFFDHGTGTLREFFTDNWQPAPGLAGRLREPGHHWEWAFLLHEFGRRTGTDHGASIDALTGFALAHGHDAGTGLAYDEVLEDGTVHTPNVRLWPQTEALRGLEMLRQRGRTDLDDRLTSLAGALYDRFLVPAPAPGMWIDRLDREGRGLSDTVPASSLYHLVTGILALQ